MDPACHTPAVAVLPQVAPPPWAGRLQLSLHVGRHPGAQAPPVTEQAQLAVPDSQLRQLHHLGQAVCPQAQQEEHDAQKGELKLLSCECEYTTRSFV
jgi:hypothetical protein